MTPPRTINFRDAAAEVEFSDEFGILCRVICSVRAPAQPDEDVQSVMKNPFLRNQVE
jgi:hypothetical protein